MTARGTLHEPGALSFRVTSVKTGKVVRTGSLASVDGSWVWSWNGRNSAGTLQPAGSYRIEQTVRDALGNKVTSARLVTLSLKRLYWHSTSKTLSGRSYDAVLDPGDGYVSRSKSHYTGGVQIASGHAEAGVRYSFSLVSATTYGTLSFSVLGRSPNGRQAIIAVWSPSRGSALDVGAYDAAKLAGPGYAWWVTSTSTNTHRSGRSVRGLVAVFFGSSAASFDIAQVKVTYRYAILR